MVSLSATGTLKSMPSLLSAERNGVVMMWWSYAYFGSCLVMLRRFSSLAALMAAYSRGSERNRMLGSSRLVRNDVLMFAPLA